MRRMQREERRARERRRALGMLAAGVVGVALLVGATLALGRRAQAESPSSPSAVAPAIAQVAETTAPVVQPAPQPKPRAKKMRVVSAAPAPAAKPTAARPASARESATPAPATQRISIRIGPNGYEPSTARASSTSPIVLKVGKGEGCAAGFLMPSLGISKDNSAGSVTIRLGKLKPGTYTFTCAMSMVGGQLVVN